MIVNEEFLRFMQDESGGFSMTDPLKVIVFKMNEQCFALELDYVQSIERNVDITEVPDAPRYVKGICHIHGEVVPVIELKERLSFGTTTYDETTRYLIVQLYDTKLGLVIDDACDVVDIETEQLHDVPGISQWIDHQFIKHVVKMEDELIIMLQLENVFQEADVELFSSV